MFNYFPKANIEHGNTQRKPTDWLTAKRRKSTPDLMRGRSPFSVRNSMSISARSSERISDSK